MAILLFDLETGGLSPLSSRISCISCIVVGEDKVHSFFGDFEKKILDEFVAFVKEKKISKIVAYNGWSFDIPFLRVRSLSNKVSLPCVFWQDRYLVDPYNVLCRSRGGKQSDFAKLFNMPSIGNGAECVALFEKGEFDKIVEHCESDIFVLKRLFEQMVECGFS